MKSLQAIVFRLPVVVEARLLTLLKICGVSPTQPHQHGNGPIHSQIPTSNNLVTELYPESKSGLLSRLVLVVTVTNLVETESKLKAHGFCIKKQSRYLLVEVEKKYLQLQIWSQADWYKLQ